MEPPEKVSKSVSRVGIACEQALQLGKLQEVTREQRAKGDASAMLARKLVLRLRLPLRLGQFWVELPYGTVRGDEF